MSFSMASTCRLRCFRYMPQARQYDSNSSPNRWLTVLLCISDLHKCRRNTNEEAACVPTGDVSTASPLMHACKEHPETSTAISCSHNCLESFRIKKQTTQKGKRGRFPTIFVSLQCGWYVKKLCLPLSYRRPELPAHLPAQVL